MTIQLVFLLKSVKQARICEWHQKLIDVKNLGQNEQVRKRCKPAWHWQAYKAVSSLVAEHDQFPRQQLWKEPCLCSTPQPEIQYCNRVVQSPQQSGWSFRSHLRRTQKSCIYAPCWFKRQGICQFSKNSVNPKSQILWTLSPEFSRQIQQNSGK